MLRKSAPTLAIVALLLRCSAVAAGQSTQGAVSGHVIDASGGVLPGVTVAATAADGQLLATSVTDGSGEYMLPALPAAPIALQFHLEGFASVTVPLIVQAGAESQVVERLDLAPLAETVEVQGRAPVEPSRPTSPLRQPRVVTRVPVHRDSICGPAKPGAESASLGAITSGLDDARDGLYTTGAELVIDRGLDNGLEVGRNLVVRRRYRIQGGESAHVIREHSAGLLQIVEADEHSSVAVVVYACDELRKGDFLTSFAPESVPEDPPGAIESSDAAPILFADEGQTLGAPRQLMVIGRGAEQGTFVGQRFTLFRQRPGAAGRHVVGDAVVVAVRADSATIRIDRVSDVVSAGDWATPSLTPSRPPSNR